MVIGSRFVAGNGARTGAVTLFHDHARLLGPIGALPDDGDRRRLLVDLLDDALLPLGSAIVTGEVRPGSRTPAMLRVTSRLQQHDLELAPNSLRLVDLPPGVPARVDVEMRDGHVLGVRARRIALDVAGGLGGLLIDTRDVPLRLPEGLHGECRRGCPPGRPRRATRTGARGAAATASR